MWFKNIMKINLIFFFIFLSTQIIFPQSLTDGRASQFIEAMINNSDTLEKFVLPEELALSKRLGIIYEGIKNKFLISYEIPEEILNEITNGESDYKINIEKLDEQFSILHFEVPAKNYKTQYYFKNEYLISPPYFYYRDWKKIESQHFIFYVSEPKYFNNYSIEMLEDFYKYVYTFFELGTENERTLLKAKIIYILCKDENEIEKLTGYKARGMCNLAYDYLITTFNCHYHELVHLLINFKLKKLPLYTHPFLQEGLAVAVGGRGGKEPQVIINLGYYLVDSGFMNYKDLLDADGFKNYDASMSYPMCGLYNDFMLGIYVFDEYLKIYRKYSSKNITGMKISPDDLAYERDWSNFLSQAPRYITIKTDFDETGYRTILEDSLFLLKEKDEYYLIETRGNILISTPVKEDNYTSKTFIEYFPDKDYKEEKYFLRISNTEVALYNLYTNNLTGNYASGFTLDMKPVPKENGFYKFLIRRDLIKENPDQWQIKIMADK
jgi:hypothetical protein